MERWLSYQLFYFFLVLSLPGLNGQGDGSSPEEICPCQAEDTCQGDRHIFGRDPLDIQNFGLLSPCFNFNDFPCCPQEPPPPKEIKITPQDLEGFSPAELAELGITNEGTIGSSSLPLAQQQDQLELIQENQQPIDITRPGAASLAPAGAVKPDLTSKNEEVSESVKVADKQSVNNAVRTSPVPNTQYYQQPVPPAHRRPPVYYQGPPQQPKYPAMYPMSRYPPQPQRKHPVYSYAPMYRPHHPYKKF